MNARKSSIAIHTVVIIVACAAWACGGSAPPPEAPAQDEEVTDDDLIGSIVGDVEVTEEDVAEETMPGEYGGPTSLTVNLKVINDKNPEGSFRLLDMEGKPVIDGGKLGDTVLVDQGAYTLEFKSPLVFGDPVYLVENVDVTGESMTLDEVFPAGQVTLHTYRKNPGGKCIPTKFTVHNESPEEGEAKDLPGKGTTCEPLILETGAYEVLLLISKKKAQPVKMRINREQVSTAPVKLER